MCVTTRLRARRMPRRSDASCERRDVRLLEFDHAPHLHFVPSGSRARRRLAHDPHAAAVPVDLQGTRAGGDDRAGARQGRQCRRAGADEVDRRRARPAHRDAGGAARAAGRVRPPAAVDDRVHRAARIPVRQGDAALGANDRAGDLPPPARAVAALPPRAPDRRPHAGRRARPARNLDLDQLHALLHPADAGRDRARVGDPDRALRLDLRRDRADRARAATSPRRSSSPTGAPGSAGR